MPRLAIAKNFLGEYAKLEKSVQSAVESAIGKFEAHTHAGLHLEKIHNSRDDRIARYVSTPSGEASSSLPRRATRIV